MPRCGDERMHEPIARRHGFTIGRVRRLAGLDQWPIHRSSMHFARQGIPNGSAAPDVGRLVNNDNTVREDEFTGGGTVVGESADDFAVVIAIIGSAVRFHNRPVGKVLKYEVGRILNTPLLLDASAAPERDIAAAAYRVPSCMRLRFE